MQYKNNYIIAFVWVSNLQKWKFCKMVLITIVLKQCDIIWTRPVSNVNIRRFLNWHPVLLIMWINLNKKMLVILTKCRILCFQYCGSFLVTACRMQILCRILANQIHRYKQITHKIVAQILYKTRFMVFNSTFENISAIPWPGGNWSTWQTPPLVKLSHVSVNKQDFFYLLSTKALTLHFGNFCSQ